MVILVHPAFPPAHHPTSLWQSNATVPESHLIARCHYTQVYVSLRMLIELNLLHVHNRRACQQSSLLVSPQSRARYQLQCRQSLYPLINSPCPICFTRKLSSPRPGLWHASGFPPIWSASYQKPIFCSRTLRVASTPSLIKVRRRWPFV